jgi:hypothetical protein
MDMLKHLDWYNISWQRIITENNWWHACSSITYIDIKPSQDTGKYISQFSVRSNSAADTKIMESVYRRKMYPIIITT